MWTPPAPASNLNAQPNFARKNALIYELQKQRQQQQQRERRAINEVKKFSLNSSRLTTTKIDPLISPSLQNIAAFSYKFYANYYEYLLRAGVSKAQAEEEAVILYAKLIETLEEPLNLTAQVSTTQKTTIENNNSLHATQLQSDATMPPATITATTKNPHVNQNEAYLRFNKSYLLSTSFSSPPTTTTLTTTTPTSTALPFSSLPIITPLAYASLAANAMYLNYAATTAPPHAMPLMSSLTQTNVLPSCTLDATLSSTATTTSSTKTVLPNMKLQSNLFNANLSALLNSYNSDNATILDLNRLSRKRPQSSLSDIGIASTTARHQKDECLAQAEIDLLPPPKKKWIRHYLKEDAFSSSNILTSNNNNKNQHNTIPPNSNSNGLIFLPISTNAHEQKHQQELQELQQQHLHCKNIAKAKTTTFTLVDNTIAENVVVASKQMLLNGGIRIAAPAATIGSTAIAEATTKAINIPQLPPQYNNANHIISSAHSLSSRHKVFIPLTPPPISSRKLAEPNQRIRSYSLSSNKISANQSLLLHNGGSNSNSSNSNHMIVDDAHMNYVTAAAASGSSNHSPPRGLASSGNHYMQMMSSAQQGAGSQVVTHVTPPIGSSGRRRTISSNSNGAGTREVHNKLEKHRRAHLKECYATLKDQLQLKDEDRKKTSNLAILAEALNVVQSLQKQDQNLEGEMEKLAKEKINLQKRSNNLKRELGPKYEQMFSGILPDIDLGSIPNERENINDTVSLSSGRGSLLYSSSSSLSSGGSNGSNTMSSPIGAGLQTAIPTTISPVISKTNSNTTIITNHHHNNTSAVAAATSSVVTTPISPNIQQHYKTSLVAAPVSANNSPTGSPTAALNGIVSPNNSMPLSLTAKNISATSLTRGSPTPSTPSPSPSSSSGVSSSSSLISSSPPINGVISGRSVTVNIPNGLKFQTNGGATIGTIGNGTASAAATIIATSPPGGNIVAAAGSVNGANNNNAHTHATAAVSVASAHNTNAPNGYRQQHGRKTSLSIGDDNKNHSNSNNAIIAMKNADKRDYEDGEQPAKFIKVYNGLITASSAEHITTTTGASVKQMMITPPTLNANSASTAAVMGQLQLTQVVGGGSLVVSPSSYATATVTTSSASSSTASTVMRSHMSAAHVQQVLLNGSSITSEIGRLPGGAELNILPTNGVVTGGALKSQTGCSTAATTFYHANGKLSTTLVNGGTAAGGNNAYLLKDNNLVMPVTTTATALQFAAAASTTTGFTPLIVAASAHNNSNANNSIQYTYAGNFAQLIAATSGAATATSTAAHMQNIIAASNAPSSSCIDRLNGKLSLLHGGQAPPINAQYLNPTKPMVVTVTATADAEATTKGTIKTTETQVVSLMKTNLTRFKLSANNELITTKNAARIPTYAYQ